MSFQTVSGDRRLRVVVVGAGGMGTAWAGTVQANPGVELVGLADIALDAAREAARKIGRPDVALGPDGVELARLTGADAIVNATVPAAHHPVTVDALTSGIAVLGEKPVASSVAEALSLAAAAQLTGRLFMVSQSRRYSRALRLFKRQLDGLGGAGILTVDFFKAPRFGGFRDEMASPLLLDMAIHQFDLARFLLDADPVAVVADEYNPGWSWYAGNAAATATFEMTGGARFVFSGSWCSPGFETSWNGSWRASAEGGTALWDGDGEPAADPARPDTGSVADPGAEIEGALREFVAALRTGAEPMGRVHTNVMSLAMVEAAVAGATSGRRIRLDDLLAESYAATVSAERNPDVRAVLESWPSVREGLARGA